MPAVNLATVLLNYEGAALSSGPDTLERTADGNPVFDTATGKPKVLQKAPDLTLAEALYTALDSQLKGDEALSGTEKIKIAKLRQKLLMADMVELDTAEKTLLLARCEKVWATLPYFRIDQLLAGDRQTYKGMPPEDKCA